jgi:hypothetical protein
LGGILWWLFLLPSWKFGGMRIAFGLVMLFSTLAWSFVFKLAYTKFGKSVIFLVLALFIVCQIKNIFNIEDKSALIANYLFVPPNYPIPVTKSVLLGEIAFQIPVEVDIGGSPTGCWGARLPCINGLGKFVEPRGKTILAGFRKKINK